MARVIVSCDVVGAFGLLVGLVGGCDLTPPAEPSFRPSESMVAQAQPHEERASPPVALQVPPAPAPVPAAPTRDVAVHPEHPTATSADPLHGQFTLAQATAGLPAGRSLAAEIETTLGTFRCDLLSEQAPSTVANFMGLARGLRDFWDPVAGQWTRRAFYDGSVFHRVIPGFMVQGGDVLRSGFGGTGYEIADENVRPHDAPGLLCMANHGPNTNGGQFFITEAPKAHLDGSYSIFGRCAPSDLGTRIAAVPRNARDVPLDPVFIRHVRITRR